VAPELARRPKETVAGVHSLVVDVSDARAIIRLEGEGVREVLMKGAPVDLTAPEYTPGTVRRVSFGEIAALLHMVSDSPDTFDLYVFRSYAVFAWQWLLATARAGARISLFGPQPPPTA
jgi:sarcosine oxidase subunit gamma